ncbi:MAG: hypothetical protein K2G83_00450 [Ruminococcus sp.]|nr:hypothetical protein [Ruminococcus sp.]
MLTSVDVGNISNVLNYIYDAENEVVTVANELGRVINPDSEVYTKLMAVLSGLQNDLNTMYTRTSNLMDERYVTY